MKKQIFFFIIATVVAMIVMSPSLDNGGKCNTCHKSFHWLWAWKYECGECNTFRCIDCKGYSYSAKDVAAFDTDETVNLQEKLMCLKCVNENATILSDEAYQNMLKRYSAKQKGIKLKQNEEQDE